MRSTPGWPWPAWMTNCGCLAIGVLIILAVSIDQWIRKVKA